MRYQASIHKFWPWLSRVSKRARSIMGRLMSWRLIQHLHHRRVPVLLQMNAVECGAACLAMVLDYHGRKTRVAECSEVCRAGRDGLTAQNIAQAARSYGLRVVAFSLEPSHFKDVSVPAIAHWEFNHFVVVEQWSPKWVEIVDPASGRRRVTARDFAASFTGVVLTLEPGVHFRTLGGSSRTRWQSYLIGMLRTPGASGLMLQILGASLCTLLFGLAVPLFTKVIVDRVLPLHIVSIMAILGLGLVLVAMAQAVATYLRAALLIYLQGRVDAQMMLGFFEHLLGLPLRFFQERTNGDLLMRLVSNATIREGLTNQTLSAILDGALVLGYLAILLDRAPLFGLLALALGFLQVVPLVGASRRLRDLTQRDLAAQSASQSYLTEALSGMATLKASGTEDHALEHWSNLFANELNASLRRGHCLALLDTAATTLHTLSPLLLVWLGTFQVLHGAMSLGTMLAVVGLATAFLQPVSSLLTGLQRMQLVAANVERIADVLEAEPEQAPAVTQCTPPLTGRIELRNVSFHYAPSAPPVLRNISLSIDPGQKVALVGRTGSGKSTLAMLLLGLYAPTEGEILYDGLPLQRLNYRALRSQFGVVLQEPFLFSGSIRQNIAFSNPNLRFDQVVEAAQLAVIHEEISGMPMGYETRVSERGSGLSGGQRQRISLARALVRQPAILLLDEATSHLDVVTELRVEHNLNQLACTRIVIAHRMSSICNADQIVVLEDGVVVEHGRHHELISRDGRYATLVDGSAGPPPVDLAGSFMATTG